MIETVHVDLGDRSYDILIGQGLIGSAATHLLPLLKRKRVAIVTDENVASYVYQPCNPPCPRLGLSMTV